MNKKYCLLLLISSVLICNATSNAAPPPIKTIHKNQITKKNDIHKSEPHHILKPSSTQTVRSSPNKPAFKSLQTPVVNSSAGSIKVHTKDTIKANPAKTVFSDPVRSGKLPRNGTAKVEPTVSTSKNQIKKVPTKNRTDYISQRNYSQMSKQERIYADKIAESPPINAKPMNNVKGDARFPREHGWRKSSYTVKTKDNKSIKYHYQHNTITNQVLDIKVNERHMGKPIPKN